MRRLSNVIGFDDAPFAREHRGDVRVVGVIRSPSTRVAFVPSRRTFPITHPSSRVFAKEAEALIRGTRVHGRLPEPLRAAHLIAGAIATGTSRGRA